MGLTVILVSHSMEDVARLADRILVMNKGNKEMFDTPENIFRNADRLTEIGLNVPQVTKIVDELRRRGMPLKEGVYTINDALYCIKKALSKGEKIC